MMTDTGGFQSYFPSNGNRRNSNGYSSGGGNYPNNFHRSNTYMPPNSYQNPPYYPQQPYAPQPLKHINTYIPPPPPMNPQPLPPPMNYPQQNPIPPQQNNYQQQNSYQQQNNYRQQNSYPQQNDYPPKQNDYPPKQNDYPPKQNDYPPQQQQNNYSPYPPKQNNYAPQQNAFQRSNTYMPPSPYQNPPQQQYIQSPPPSYQNAPYQAPPMAPPQEPIVAPYRANTYRPPRPAVIQPPMPVVQLPVVSVTDFDPEQDCQVLRNAVHGIGTDEKAIINIIVNRNGAQRAAIRNCYKSCYGKDLIKRLKEDTSGNFKQVIAGMFMTPAEYDAMCLYKAMKGLGTSEGVLIEIIGTRTNEELREIREVFEREYKGTLEKWIIGDTSGNFKNLLVALLQGERSMNPNPDPAMCQNDAQALYNAGEGRWGTDEPTFIKIFSKRSAAEIAMINDFYIKLRGKGLLRAIDKEFSGDIKKLLQTVVGGLLDRPGYFATRIREAVKGLGTNDSKLVRVIVSRCEKDLGLIKQAYQRIYSRDMLHDVRDDTSGYYRDILTGLISRV
jgi:annexin A7/11